MTLTAEEVRTMLRYNRRTGELTWRRRADVPKAWNTRFAGKRAGRLMANGYWYLAIHRRLYQRSRIAWLHVHGAWPKEEIDHKNRHPSDDRLANLRECSRGENNKNCKTHSHSRSGIKGVLWRADKQKWSARIRSEGKTHHLGHFDTAEKATRAHRAAQKIYHGEFACTGESA